MTTASCRLPETGTTATVRERVRRLREPGRLDELAARHLGLGAGPGFGPPRVWPKPGGRFVLLARSRGGGPPAYLTAYLFREGAALPRVAGGTGAAIESESLLLQPFPQDFRLRHLAALADPERAASRLDLARIGSVEPLAYWPGKRALLRVETDSVPLFCKVFREPESVRQIGLAHASLAGIGGVRLPAPAGSSLDPPFLVTAAVTGEPMDAASRSLPAADLAAAGAALARLHRARLDPGRRFLAGDEIGVAAAWVAVALELHPELGEAIRPPWARLSRLVPPPAGGMVLLHRDYHDRQVLLAPGEPPAVVDLDTLARGDAALDLGNFEAHLMLRGFEAGLAASVVAARVAAFRCGYASEAVFPVASRIRFYRATSLLRLAAVYALRPGPPDLPSQLAAAAGEVLAAGDE